MENNLPQIPIDEIETQFLAFMRDNNCEPYGNFSLKMDGQLHRYRTFEDKHGQTSGAYCVYADGYPAGWCQDWRHGGSINWTFDKSKLDTELKKSFTKDNIARMQKISEQHQAEMKKQQESLHTEASERARLYFEQLPTTDKVCKHPYLINKQVYSYGLRIDKNSDTVVVPLYNADGKFATLQWIYQDGTKRFFPSAPKKGAFFSIGLSQLNTDAKVPILIGEGYATMATIYEATGMPCVASMDCGNLGYVAQILKVKYPKHKIVIMADNDHKTKGNPGLTTAKKVKDALQLSGIAYPEFDENDSGTDWNDYHNKHDDAKTYEVIHQKINEQLIPELVRQKLHRIEQIDGNSLLKKEFKPLKWAVEGMIPSGFSILAGAPKVGKSRLALNISLAVAIEHGCALGCIDVKCGDVLYLALEDTQRRLQERILDANLGKIDLSRLTVVTQIPRQHEGGMEYIKWWLDEHTEARLVIIDTLQRFRKQLSGKGDRYSEDYDVVSEIKSVADKYDVPILVIHHLTKAKDTDDWINEISGSMGIAGAADTIFSLKRARTDMFGILHRTGRDVEEKDFSLRLEEFGWVLVGDAEDFTMPEWKRNIIKYLREHDTVSPIELSTALEISLDSAQKNLQRLTREGKIVREGRGIYKLLN